MKIDWAHFLYKIKALKSDRYGCKEGSQTLKYVSSEHGIQVNISDYYVLMSSPQAIHYIAAFML
ncbi:uncharacterized protein ATNIH1004_008203 [Aspergillus tanneri]|uniref:Uncharacterized protein n=1 Tax=Aspergillus tanneri TaxID=1220188 RepID=A0A5M9MMQ2_9EURO|nr:uncharacterized protein ATNIH1004_008203 [Aspergillus tanneri]KAA8644007.1 hypothetical protein ATNIH1004_008203 [Aspergillus tanneri]